MTDATCHGITREGKRCRARPLAGSTYCVNHSPDVTDEQRRAWAAKGGANSASKVRARKQLPGEAIEPEELAAWLAIAFKRVLAEKMDPGVANALSTMSRAMLAVRESVEIETRLNALEKAVEGQQMSNGRYTA